MSNNFSVSIVTYNSDLRNLEKTLRSLAGEIDFIESQSNFSVTTIEIVDNASTEVYRENLKTLVSQLSICTKTLVTLLDKNIGFGQGHNIALSKSNSNYHLFLNPDLEFLNHSLIEGLNSLNNNPNIGLVAPRIFNLEMKEQNLHGRKPKLTDLALRSIAPTFLKRLFKRRLNNLYNVPFDETITNNDPIFISGCCMLLNTQAAKTVNGFSEKYFLYFEDYDFTEKIQNIRSVLINSKFLVKHYGGNTHKKPLLHWKYYIKSMVKYLYKSK
ncbi:glycosyltransferase family 2 protein [Sessilibacter sp. MAH1]